MEENKAQVNAIKNSLINLIKMLERALKSDVKRIEMLYKIRDAVELNLYFNNEDQKQLGDSLRI